jgi:hypothetical protein
MRTLKGAAHIFARLPPSPHEMQRRLQEELRQDFGLPPEARMAMHHFDLELKTTTHLVSPFLAVLGVDFASRVSSAVSWADHAWHSMGPCSLPRSSS